MVKDHSGNVKISFPRWVSLPFSLGWIVILLTFIFYAVRLGSESSVLELLKSVLLLIILLAGFWFFFKLLFYSVTATENGLETANPFGSSKSILWDEIVEVRRPRFSIPYDFTYVISKNKDKLLLVGSMQNYNQLIELIKVKAPNLQK